MQAIIIGAGIGGLTTALCFHEAGIKCQVFESAAAIKELGVGINILPHAVKEYERLGLQERLLAEGVELERYMWFNRHGQQIWSEPRGKFAGYNWPQISIHRGRFHSVLLGEVSKRLGRDVVQPNHHFVDLEQGHNGVTAHFIEKKSGKPTRSHEADLLVGADGIHSNVRAIYYPGEGPPVWNGNMLWRTTLETDPVLNGQAMIAVGNSRLKIVGYEISAETKSRGKSLFNFIAEVRTGQPGDSLPQTEDWNRRGRTEEFASYFEDWKFDWLDVPDIISRIKDVWVFPMIDRDPVSNWSFGRVTLLGDAAHSMWPIGSNGASQAVLDARCLTDQLQEIPDITEALQTYSDLRLPATARVVYANRANAHDEILEIAEQRAPDGFSDINEFTTPDEIEGILSGYKTTAQFSRDQLQDD